MGWLVVGVCGRVWRTMCVGECTREMGVGWVLSMGVGAVCVCLCVGNVWR